MKGIILAGGNGTRLRPITLVTNKHLLPVYNKPMILFPLNTLKDLGIKDILIVSGGEHIGSFMEFLGDGSEYGVNLTYRIQKEAGGIAQALYLAKDFVKDDNFAVILGDNIFEYSPKPPKKACSFVLKEVENPSRFGVYHNGKIIEKPTKPKSNLAVTGLYFYTPEIFSFIEKLKPGFWSDAGTFDSLLDSSNFIKSR